MVNLNIEMCEGILGMVAFKVSSHLLMPSSHTAFHTPVQQVRLGPGQQDRPSTLSYAWAKAKAGAMCVIRVSEVGASEHNRKH